MLRNGNDQPSKSRAKNGLRRIIKRLELTPQIFKSNSRPTMLKSLLCDYSDAYILAKGTIRITGAEADAAARNADERNNQVTI